MKSAIRNIRIESMNHIRVSFARWKLFKIIYANFPNLVVHATFDKRAFRRLHPRNDDRAQNAVHQPPPHNRRPMHYSISAYSNPLEYSIPNNMNIIIARRPHTIQ